jgi:hypothetical protein
VARCESAPGTRRGRQPSADCRGGPFRISPGPYPGQHIADLPVARDLRNRGLHSARAFVVRDYLESLQLSRCCCWPLGEGVARPSWAGRRPALNAKEAPRTATGPAVRAQRADRWPDTLAWVTLAASLVWLWLRTL